MAPIAPRGLCVPLQVQPHHHDLADGLPVREAQGRGLDGIGHRDRPDVVHERPPDLGVQREVSIEGLLGQAPFHLSRARQA